MSARHGARERDLDGGRRPERPARRRFAPDARSEERRSECRTRGPPRPWQRGARREAWPAKWLSRQHCVLSDECERVPRPRARRVTPLSRRRERTSKPDASPRRAGHPPGSVARILRGRRLTNGALGLPYMTARSTGRRAPRMRRSLLRVPPPRGERGVPRRRSLRSERRARQAPRRLRNSPPEWSRLTSRASGDQCAPRENPHPKWPPGEEPNEHRVRTDDPVGGARALCGRVRALLRRRTARVERLRGVRRAR